MHNDGRVDPGTIIAGAAASASAIGAFIAIWQAVSAGKQAKRAKEQADAATVQAREAVRTADAAEGQVKIAQEQLRHMEAEAHARVVNEVRSNFSQFVSSIRLFVIACGRLEKQLRQPGEDEAIPELMQELVLANPIAHPSVMVLASHLSKEPPVISALNETMEAINAFWRYCNALTDALGRSDKIAVERNLHKFHPLVKRIADRSSALYRVGVENLVPPGAVTASPLVDREG
jgi:hypothetical protein